MSFMRPLRYLATRSLAVGIEICRNGSKIIIRSTRTKGELISAKDKGFYPTGNLCTSDITRRLVSWKEKQTGYSLEVPIIYTCVIGCVMYTTSHTVTCHHQQKTWLCKYVHTIHTKHCQLNFIQFYTSGHFSACYILEITCMQCISIRNSPYNIHYIYCMNAKYSQTTLTKIIKHNTSHIITKCVSSL